MFAFVSICRAGGGYSEYRGSARLWRASASAEHLEVLLLFETLRRKAHMVTAEDALPGRDVPLRVDPTHAVLGTSIVPPYPANTEEIVLGLGCFWGAERLFWQLPGVYATAVGYAGGFTRTRRTRRSVAAAPGTPRWSA